MVDFSKLIAHTQGQDGKEDHLIDHLRDVAVMARSFAEKFNCGALAFWLGLLHDLGKINPLFQSYLKSMEENRSHPKAPHAIWGASFMYYLLWCKKQKDAWKEFALPIYGHHAGLQSHGLASQKFSQFLRDNPSKLQSMVSAWTELQQRFTPESPSFRIANDTRREMRVRMVFSALVDADYLATENHFEPQKADNRGKWPELSELWERFRQDQDKLLKKAEAKPSEVNRIRREVYNSCLDAAKSKPGVFKLTVPTGGGKTRSGLAFALQHAIQNKNDFCRIIVALPYTSIIDQTASEYSNILEKENECVLEHHSQMDVPDKKEEQDPKHLRYRLATENWDAPVIVTTTVQLFESLFSNKPGRARKLHNIARSVLILDEVQTLPPQLLKPTLGVLRDLVDHYGVSLVLSTATQPAFDNTPYLKPFQNIEAKEIVPSYAQHFKMLKRVDYEFRPESLDWSELGEEIENLNQVMVVLNTRKDALALIDAMGETPHIYHLSTLLCGRHRKDKLYEIRKRLDDSQPVRLISTQVVEAGVDLDFPVVYRALGPLDRIVQAAGRCNREWRDSKKLGQVVIFQPEEGGIPRGAYLIGKTEAQAMLQKYGPNELHNPEIFVEYFQRLFSDLNEKLDEKRIQDLRMDLNYPEASKRYRLIPNNTVPVVVNYQDALSILNEWERDTSRRNWRRLQPYVVNIYRWQIERFRDWLHPLQEDTLFQWVGKYHDVRGISNEAIDPADLIVSNE
ncbi:MAG: CRISPR-associated helicase Cas3' [Desulfobacterales bacterium]|nr:CRISPR-associated helicase Cas3' [Desulfobacterales bacterium]